MIPHVSHDESMAEVYRDDPELAVEVLDSILEDGDLDLMRIVVRQLAIAFKDGRVVPK